MSAAWCGIILLVVGAGVAVARVRADAAGATTVAGVPLPSLPTPQMELAISAFEMGKAPAPAPAPTGRSFEIIIGAIEFEMPPEPFQVVIGPVEFEMPPLSPREQAADTRERLRRAAREVLKSERQSREAMNRALDEMERKRGRREPARRWHARGVPGGNAEVGTLHGSTAAEIVTYTAPQSIPGDPAVPIQVREGESQAKGTGDLSAAAVAIILDTDAVLTARWSFQERMRSTFDRTEEGTVGSRRDREESEWTVSGSGLLRFEDRPMHGMGRQEWEEARAGMIGMAGIRPLMLVHMEGSVGIDGAEMASARHPHYVADTATTLVGRMIPPGQEAAGFEMVQLKRKGRGWMIEEWNAHAWRPQLQVTRNISGFERRYAQHTPGSAEWFWRQFPVTRTFTDQRHPFEIYDPMARPEHHAAPHTTVDREGSLELLPSGPNRFVGRLRLSFAYQPPSDGRQSYVSRRSVVWEFELQTAAP